MFTPRSVMTQARGRVVGGGAAYKPHPQYSSLLRVEDVKLTVKSKSGSTLLSTPKIIHLGYEAENRSRELPSVMEV
uniref:Uncharacterized protein n=1 Tax=Timema cristinae TaxID=61476 RepID=A0A7R9DR36_TIMCR|nr:unnamed protein product [Timema cristinae]